MSIMSGVVKFTLFDIYPFVVYYTATVEGATVVDVIDVPLDVSFDYLESLYAEDQYNLKMYEAVERSVMIQLLNS